MTANECELAKRKLKGLFVEDCHISASSVEDPGTVGGKVGGQLVIIRGAWRTAVRNSATDRAGLGGLLIVYLKTKCSTLAIANTYWPTLPANAKDTSNALHNKYVRWMRSVNMTGNPIDYIRSAIEDKLDKNKERISP